MKIERGPYPAIELRQRTFAARGARAKKSWTTDRETDLYTRKSKKTSPRPSPTRAWNGEGAERSAPPPYYWRKWRRCYDRHLLRHLGRQTRSRFDWSRLPFRVWRWRGRRRGPNWSSLARSRPFACAGTECSCDNRSGKARCRKEVAVAEIAEGTNPVVSLSVGKRWWKVAPMTSSPTSETIWVVAPSTTTMPRRAFAPAKRSTDLSPRKPSLLPNHTYVVARTPGERGEEEPRRRRRQLRRHPLHPPPPRLRRPRRRYFVKSRGHGEFQC